MGGDGGVVATNRKYMRGAGTADHTGDSSRHGGGNAQHFNALEVMTTCALTKTSLFSSSSTTSAIVADPYGNLYHKEAAIQALLRRKQQQEQQQTKGNQNTASTILGPHVRGMKDLYDVRFHRGDENGASSSFPICPITGKALTGSIPAILLVIPSAGNTTTTQQQQPNVVSEGALKQLSTAELEAEYGGPITKRIRLAPPPTLLEQHIRPQVEAEHERDEADKQRAKQKKKKQGKRKQLTTTNAERERDDDDDDDDNNGNKKKKKKSKKEPDDN